MRMLVVGNVAVDEAFVIDSLPRAGESIFGIAAGRDLGGKGANQAVVIARAGLDVAFVSATGDDDRGDWIRAALVEEGVDTRHVACVSRPSDLSIILTDRDGENTIMTTTEAARAVRREHVDPALGSATPGDWLVMQGNFDPALTRSVLHLGRQRGLITAFNPSPMCQNFAELVSLSDVLVANRMEAAELSRRADPEAAATKLRELGAGTVVITLGAGGALILSAYGLKRVAARRAKCVDATGAGDTFMAAAIVSAAMRGLGAPDAIALEAAAEAAALTVSRVGTCRAFPTRDEMRALLA